MLADRNALGSELHELGVADRAIEGDSLGQRALEILPPDTREYWSDTRRVPYRLICSLELFFENPAHGPRTPKWLMDKATGVLIGPDCVLTAAHTLWRKINDRQHAVKRIEVVPGRDGRSEPFGRVQASGWQTPSAWDPKSEPRAWDFAVVRLSQAIGSKTFKIIGGDRLGWWGIDFGDQKTLTTPLDPVWLKGRSATSAGYPGDTCGQHRLADPRAIERCQRDKPNLYAASQWRGGGMIRSIDCLTGLLHHTIDTYEGQSGSPIWYLYEDKDKKQQRRWLVGLHVAPGTLFQASGSSSPTRIDNVGVWMRQTVLDEIVALAKRLGATLPAAAGTARPKSPAPARERETVGLAADPALDWREPRAEHETPRDQVRRPAPPSSLPPECAQPSPWPDRPCGDSKPSTDIEQRRIRRLCEVISAGIEAKEHAPQARGAGVFAGSYDWHSAVHAHWALLSIARTRRDTRLEAWLAARLSENALRAEREFLKKDGQFELPYGRAWLLLLLSELGRRPRAPKQMVALQQDMQESVLRWLETSPYPELGTGAAPRFVAQHGSWLFAYMLFALANPKPAGVRDRLRALRKSKVEPARGKLAAAKHSDADFLFLPAVQAVVDRVDPASPAQLAAYPVGAAPALLDPPLDAANAHSAGAALVRIWPHAIDMHAGDARACSRFHARMNEMFSRTDQWADSFPLVSHWVPQFMWMALWLAAGRP